MTGAAGFASGDTAYLSPAGPFREVVTVAMTSATAETQIIGDPANAQGFKTSGGVLVAPGDVIWTAYTTDDITTSSTSALLNLAGRDFLTFKNILMIGGNLAVGSCVLATTTNSISTTFRDCVFMPSRASAVTVIAYTGLADVASNWTIDRCRFGVNLNGGCIDLIFPTSASADYDTNFQITNCKWMGACTSGVNISSSGAAAFKAGGVDVFNAQFLCRGSLMVINGANLSTSIPCTVYNSVLVTGSIASINAGVSGQILEDNNRIFATTPRTNVTAGASSIADSSHAILVEIGQAEIMGRMSRPDGMPTTGSPLLGRGATAGGPTVDILNRPRPAGGASTAYAWGAYERHDTATREISIVDSGSNAIYITGPGDHDFLIPVDASSTTITVRARYDTNHAATNKPQATILNGEEIGVATETKTMTAAVDSWETLTFSAFTPSAQGFITLRLISRSAAGNGIAYFDTVNY